MGSRVVENEHFFAVDLIRPRDLCIYIIRPYIQKIRYLSQKFIKSQYFPKKYILHCKKKIINKITVFTMFFHVSTFDLALWFLKMIGMVSTWYKICQFCLGSDSCDRECDSDSDSDSGWLRFNLWLCFIIAPNSKACE